MKQILLFVLILSCCTLCLSASPFWGNAQQSASKGLATRTDNETFVFSKGGNPFLNWSSHRICAGVNIHFVTGHEQDLDMIAAAGFKFVRIDFGWQGIERQKGEYNWKAFDELTANLEKRGLGGLYILDYSNSLYEETSVSKNPLNGKEQKAVSSPQHDESVAAFARWSAAAAAHFKGKNIVWEIWNEPNISFWKPKPDVKQYTALALATCKAVKVAVPEATIIGPASSELPWPYLESFFSSGVLEYLDAVSIHPYRNYSKSPETAVADYQKLRALVGTYAPQAKKNMPIISSEWGYSTALKALPLETQAAFIVRMQLSNLLAGIPVSTWYDWKNDGTDPNDWEQNFGTVTNDLVPKPSYNAIKLMNMQLRGYMLVQRMDLKNNHDYALLFKDDKGNFKLCAWTVDQAHSVKITNKIPKINKVMVTDGNGTDSKPTIEQGGLVLDLSAMPQYVALPQGIKLN